MSVQLCKARAGHSTLACRNTNYTSQLPWCPGIQAPEPECTCILSSSTPRLETHTPHHACSERQWIDPHMTPLQSHACILILTNQVNTKRECRGRKQADTVLGGEVLGCTGFEKDIARHDGSKVRQGASDSCHLHSMRWTKKVISHKR